MFLVEIQIIFNLDIRQKLFQHNKVYGILSNFHSIYGHI